MSATEPKTNKVPDYSRWETHDQYRDVVVTDGVHRVILCRDAIQWIIQRRRGTVRPGQSAWDALSYCTTKSALVRLSEPLFDGIPPELAALPERCNQLKCNQNNGGEE